MGNKGKKYIENVVCYLFWFLYDQYTANYSIKLEFVIGSHHLWFCFGTFLYVIYLSTHGVNRHLFTIASNKGFFFFKRVVIVSMQAEPLIFIF